MPRKSEVDYQRVLDSCIALLRELPAYWKLRERFRLGPSLSGDKHLIWNLRYGPARKPGTDKDGPLYAAGQWTIRWHAAVVFQSLVPLGLGDPTKHDWKDWVSIAETPSNPCMQPGKPFGVHIADCAIGDHLMTILEGTDDIFMCFYDNLSDEVCIVLDTLHKIKTGRNKVRVIRERWKQTEREDACREYLRAYQKRHKRRPTSGKAAKTLGITEPYLSKLDPWKKLLEAERAAKCASVRHVNLSGKMQAAIADERTMELAKEIEEHKKDFEPSPLDETPVRRPVHRIK